MKTHNVMYAEDLPHYAGADTEALDTVDAIAMAGQRDLTDIRTNPDCRNAVSRRIVEVTDENETIVPQFVSLDEYTRFTR